MKIVGILMTLMVEIIQWQKELVMREDVQTKIVTLSILNQICAFAISNVILENLVVM